MQVRIQLFEQLKDTKELKLSSSSIILFSFLMHLNLSYKVSSFLISLVDKVMGLFIFYFFKTKLPFDLITTEQLIMHNLINVIKSHPN